MTSPKRFQSDWHRVNRTRHPSLGKWISVNLYQFVSKDGDANELSYDKRSTEPSLFTHFVCGEQFDGIRTGDLIE
jgi:hypothetical protein